MTMRALLFVPFVVAVLSAGSPDKGSFTSGVWHGKANYDGDGKFSDCTMMAQSKSGVLLGFVISKDFDWGLVLADESASVVEHLVGEERLRAYENALATLDRSDQELIVMRMEFGLSYQEIALELAATPDAVRMRVARALKTVAGHIAAQQE